MDPADLADPDDDLLGPGPSDPFDPELNRYWLEALDDPGSGAWDRLDQLERDVPRAYHPIREAVVFLLDVSPDKLRRATPALAYYAPRAREEPGMFARCMLEHARRVPRRSGHRIRLCVELLRDRPLLGPLVIAYEALHCPVVYWQSGPRLLAAYRSLLPSDPAPLDVETRDALATLLEADIASSLFHYRLLAASHALDLLESWLLTTPIQGRRASLLTWRARLHHQMRDHEIARSLLVEAEQELPPGLDEYQLLEILHLRAHSECACGNLDAAAEVIDRFAALVPTWGNHVHTADVPYLRGCLHLQAERYAEAEALWTEAESLWSRDEIRDALSQLRAQRRRVSVAPSVEPGGGGTTEG